MDFRLATSVPKSLTEMWERFREFVQQVQPVILLNVPIGTDETAVAHGLGEAPGHVEWDPPHCLAIVKQTRRADRNRVYLKASNACVLDIKVTRGFPRALLNSVKNGGYKLPDYDPNAFGDHRVATDATDEAAHGADYLLSKLSDSGNVKPTLDTSAGKRRVRHDVTLPTGFPGYYDNDPKPDGTANPGDSPLVSRGNHVHPSADNAGGDLYFVDEIPADLITYYGSPAFGLDNSPVLVEDPMGSWDGSVATTGQGGYMGPY